MNSSFIILFIISLINSKWVKFWLLFRITQNPLFTKDWMAAQWAPPIGRARHGLWSIPDLTILNAYTKLASLMNIIFLSNPTE